MKVVHHHVSHYNHAHTIMLLMPFSTVSIKIKRDRAQRVLYSSTAKDTYTHTTQHIISCMTDLWMLSN